MPVAKRGFGYPCSLYDSLIIRIDEFSLQFQQWRMRLFYRIAYNLVGIQLWLHGIKVEGEENVPSGGCLVVSNHASYVDPTTVGWAVRREIFYLARKTLLRPPIMNWLLPLCNVLPIDRDGRDMGSLRTIIKMLKKGEAILLFPEGTRTPDGTLQAPLPGAGFWALKSGVPVLPVRIFGSFNVLPRHAKRYHFARMRVVIGKPYLPQVPEGRKERECYEVVAQEMIDHIAALS